MTIEAQSSPFSSRNPRVSRCYEQDNVFPASAQAKPIDFLKTQKKIDAFMLCTRSQLETPLTGTILLDVS